MTYREARGSQNLGHLRPLRPAWRHRRIAGPELYMHENIVAPLFLPVSRWFSSVPSLYLFRIARVPLPAPPAPNRQGVSLALTPVGRLYQDITVSD